MNESPVTDAIDDPRQTFSVLTGCVERFVDAWETNEYPPDLGDFLPSEQGPLRRLTLVELIKVDLEYRWNERDLPKQIVEYVRDFPELAEGGVPADLIYEEYHIRRKRGDEVDAAEYVRQFPEQATELRCLLGLGQPYETTALYREPARRALDDVQVGAKFDDFDLLALLGKGAFASVFLARQRSMQRLVALKVSANTGTEHQTLAQLDHDFIVRVFDYRVAEGRDLRLLYMQYLPGGTLQSVVEHVRQTEPAARTGGLVLAAVQQSLESRGESRSSESSIAAKLERMNWGELVCWMGARLARALDYAHAHGILHRDVKPANVLLTAEGIPKLADFNISFCSKLSGATPAAYFGGSLAYMSPEQLEACNPAHEREADSLDGRSDLYSLGVMLWELLIGRRPFADPSVAGPWSKMLADMTRERKRKSIGADAHLTHQFPPGLLDVLRKCLAPDVHDRWATGDELAHRLELCLKPRAQDLLFPPERSWRVRLRPYAVWIIVLMIAVPNVLAGVFNWFYNREQIIKELAKSDLPGALEAFDRIQLVVNSVAYPLGMVLAGILTYSIVRAVNQPEYGESLDDASLRKLRRRGLALGRLAALVGVTEWALAGIVYPISLRLTAGPINPTTSIYFFISLLLCGLVAAGYPFFAVTFFTVRVIYPALASLDLPAVDDGNVLRKLVRRSRFYLLTTAAIPILAMMAVMLVESQTPRYALWVFSGTALIGIGLASWLFWQLQADLDALIDALGDDQ